MLCCHANKLRIPFSDSANIPLMEQLSWGDLYRPLPRHPNSVIPPYYWNPEDNHLSDYETLLNQPELCHSGTTQNGATHGGGGEGRPFLVMLVQTRPGKKLQNISGVSRNFQGEGQKFRAPKS